MRHMHNIDPHRSKKQILEELQVAASRAVEDGNIAHMTLTFAVLLVKLSDQAEETTRNIIRLRRILFWLTILVMIMILPPLIQEVHGFFYKNSHAWIGPRLPDFSEYFSRFWHWLLDLWNSFKDWFLDLWKLLIRAVNR